LGLRRMQDHTSEAAVRVRVRVSACVLCGSGLGVRVATWSRNARAKLRAMVEDSCMTEPRLPVTLMGFDDVFSDKIRCSSMYSTLRIAPTPHTAHAAPVGVQW